MYLDPPEPLSEDTKDSWMNFFNRFDKEIYPVIFAPNNISRSLGLQLWVQNALRTDIDELIEAVKGDDKEDWESGS